MCGLSAGYWCNSGSDLKRKIHNSLLEMANRGPDDSGIKMLSFGRASVGLGHVRLSIIDLSSDGHQPMSSEDGRYSLIFNGEIFNYIELRDRLISKGYVFRTNTDTEVLLKSWEVWGHDILDELVGMFAFVVFDHVSRQLTCVRDGFGIKPLLYAIEDGNFFVSSQQSALLALKSEAPKVDWLQAYRYLVQGEYDVDNRSFYDNVQHVLPGHILTVCMGNHGVQISQQQWFHLSVEEDKNIEFADAVGAVREAFLHNIKLHMRSDVPLGIALSGGVDSSAIICGARKIEPEMPIHAFSFVARGADVSEEKWIDSVVDHTGSICHKIFIEEDDLISDLDALMMAQGEPFGSTSIYAQYRVFQHAKENGITVTLDGQGADEMLAGYKGYPGQRIHSMLDDHRVVSALRFLREWSKWPDRGLGRGIGWAALSMTKERHVKEWLLRLAGLSSRPSWICHQALMEKGIFINPGESTVESFKGRRLVSALKDALTQNGLPALLRHGDRNSMAHSIESRVPFLTKNLAQLLLSLPESWLVSDAGETKHIFRVAMRGIVPDAVLDRRDKLGFATPERQWLMRISPRIRDWLRVDLRFPFLDQKEVLRQFDLICAGKQKFSWQVWRWLCFSRWCELNGLANK